MKLLKFLVITIIISFYSCSDRDNFIDDDGHSIKGVFKELSGSVSGILNKEGSPYKIISDIIVDSGKTLTITGGAELYFAENTRLIVYGELLIDGDYYNDQIILDSYDSTKHWAGIILKNADKPCLIDFANISGIRNEYDSILVPSCISVNNSELIIKHSVIFKNSAADGGGAGVYNGKLTLINNIFRDNKADYFGGAVISEGSDIKIINNTFYNNYSFNSIGAVLIYSAAATDVQNNIFYKNTSRSGVSHYFYESSDSIDYTEQYNFFAYGEMDPLFLGEFYLTLYYASPCKNAGNPDPLFNDYDGSRNDQGAFGGPEGRW